MISIGLDVGREHDPAALAVLSARGTRPSSHRPAWTLLDVGNLALGTDYLKLAEQAAGLAAEFTGAGYATVLAVDATGIGAAVLEMARRSAPTERIYGVSITSGMSLSRSSPDGFTVGKHRLTEGLTVALQQGGLDTDAHASPDGVAEFQAQMAQFVAKPRPGQPTYQRHEAASGHDDLVLAVELALWIGDAMADEAAGVAT